MLINMEKQVKYNNSNSSLPTFDFILAKHYKDNIASHKAFLKAGYIELPDDYNDTWDWKIKELK